MSSEILTFKGIDIYDRMVNYEVAGRAYRVTYTEISCSDYTCKREFFHNDIRYYLKSNVTYYCTLVFEIVRAA
jgi:hypothetical protein